MNNSYQEELERRIDAELKKLPLLDAPSSLLPGVLNALAARQTRAWWTCSWSNWPKTVQLLFIILLSILLGAAVYALSLIWKTGLDVNLVLNLFRPAVDLLQTLFSALAVIIRSPIGIWIWGTAALSFIMYLGCLGSGIACYRCLIQTLNRN